MQHESGDEGRHTNVTLWVDQLGDRLSLEDRAQEFGHDTMSGRWEGDKRVVWKGRRERSRMEAMGRHP